MSRAAPEPAATKPPGATIRRASWIGTAVFVVTAVAAAIVSPGSTVASTSTSAVGRLAVIVAAALFVAGCVIFLWAFFVMAGRSRTVRVDLAQVWFLTGPPTPPPVRRSLLGALGVEVVAGLATAGVRPYTGLAAGVLVPMYGLALCGLWAARHADFEPRPPGEGLGERRLRSDQ